MNKNNLDNRVEWQINCDNRISTEQNVILSSPTGSGKTARYEIWALNKLERPIFVTSPLKSLSNQKFREFTAKGYKVGLETGDIKYSPEDGCDIICCTQEIYNNKYTNLENSTLIIDEFSYVFENKDRARAYIDSLFFTKAKNIFICSATFGNAKDIANYINKLTNRKFHLYENKERLTTLKYKGYITKQNIKNSLVISYSKNRCIKIAEELYELRKTKLYQSNNNSTIYDIKEFSKNEILKFAQKYNIDNQHLIEFTFLGIAYYYGNLYPKEKMFLEELYENKLIDTIVGTDALSLGVNFPIQNVIFTSLHKNTYKEFKIISKNLFEQISGRAGRKGYFDTGCVYYCDDFLKDYCFDEFNLDLKKTFIKLINSKESTEDIILTPNIKNILNKNTSIDEEANFIIKYSTKKLNYEEEKNNITNIINYITSYNITTSYLKKKFNKLNWKAGYEKALKYSTPKFRKKIDKIATKLDLLQPYFNKDIGNVYMSEYSHKTNCEIFMDVLMETPLENLINKYAKTFYDLLLLKKYISNLPKKYLSPYNINHIDTLIDSYDYTVLHPNEFKIENNKSFTKQKIYSKTKK